MLLPLCGMCLRLVQMLGEQWIMMNDDRQYLEFERTDSRRRINVFERAVVAACIVTILACMGWVAFF